MGRFLLCCLLAAHVLATLATARPLHDAAAPPGTIEDRAAALGVFRHGAELKLAAGPAIQIQHHARHKPFDKSIAGAEVILGGLATAVFAAIFCYIRVTRRRSQETQESQEIKP